MILLAALALSACAARTELEPEGTPLTITAYQEGAEITKTTVQNGGTQVYWEPAEEIKVFFNGVGGRFVSQNTENATVATFSGTLPVVVGANEGAGVSTKTWGLYPYRADAVLDGDAMITTLPASQAGQAGSFAKNTNITVAQSAGYDLSFYNVCGGVRFSLTQEGIKRVTFEGNNAEALAGKVKIAFVEGVPAVQEVIEPETLITLTAPGGGTFQTGQWYYISAIPGTLSGGFTMKFYKEAESAKLVSSSSVKIKRGIFGSLSDADENVIFKPTGGEEPNPEDFIQFADPIAKYACVEKFDTNHDGEVSYAEAAAATSLEGLFTDWNTVTSFDEIQFFTGVTSTVGVFSGCSKLTHITIPDWVTTLGTFVDCTSLEMVVLPSALSSIPSSCFEGCSALKKVTFPTSITSIPSFCFRGCTVIETLTIPSTVTSFEHYAFDGCTLLANLDLPSDLQSIGNRAFRDCQAITSLAFPSTLTSIGQYAFSGCTALTSATLGSNVSLGQSAFSGCTSLASVVLPDNMTSIPGYCFHNCTSLTTIAWPQALTSIGNYAFAGCTFKDVNFALELPSSVTSIGSRAFGYLHHLLIPSTTPVNIASDSFVADYTYLYVPANMVEMYKVRTNWSNYSNCIRPLSDYPVNPFMVGAVGEAVDLGLSVKWASWNVGASAPEGYGSYLAWGETDAKGEYNWATYQWCNGEYNKFTKYCPTGITDYWDGVGSPDNKVVLDPEDDAAHVNWGGTWRMPTKEEWTELMNNCTWTWTDNYKDTGIAGRIVTSNKSGYTDKSIFLPATGERLNASIYEVGTVGYYWSTSLESSVPYLANYVYFNSGDVYWNSGSRDSGFHVRPVCD
jgi:uncharacterized protein (TIGR02145 family)